jgi:glycosyltransferase involved in cell wall biosynthesis
MAQEQSQFPPPGVQYSFLKARPSPFRLIRSPIKGYLRHVEARDQDLIEAVLSPVLTTSRWVYSLDCFQAAAAYNLLGLPLPRFARVAWIKHLLLRDNFKKLIFWSKAAKDTLHTYGGIEDEELLRKATVVYPAIREVPDNLIQFNDRDVNILFSGDFFRKGGINVVDAFERAQKNYPSIKLTLCCDERIDFNTGNTALRAEYLNKIRRNIGIAFGRVPRDELVRNVLPRTDIYLLPTYTEAFGFAILEAMAFGIPVISTNHFAIPEMVEHGVCGFLINTDQFGHDRLFRGYIVNDIPTDFREHVTDSVFRYLSQLIESAALRRRLGMAGVRIARTRFSFDARNDKMLKVYREALQ